MAFETYSGRRYGRRSMQPRTTSGWDVKPPVVQELVGFDKPVDWNRQCLSHNFIFACRKALEESIKVMEDQMFNQKMELEATERKHIALQRQEAMKLTQSRLAIRRTALEALNKVPECK